MRLILALVSCAILSFYGALQIYINCKGQQNTRSPVILVPGLGGSRIEAKLNKSDVVNICCCKTYPFYTLWVDLIEFLFIDCFLDNIKLDYNNKTRTTTNSEGVTTRIPGWGNPSVVETLDPETSWIIYFETIADMLVNDLGYIRNVSLRAAPYDFRKGPNENAEYFSKLKDLVEETYVMNHKQRVTLLAHSMGGPMSLIFLQRQSQAWKDKYINSLITLGSPWGGSMKSLQTLATGVDLVFFLEPSVFRETIRTFPGLAFLLPSKIFWKDADVLVQTNRQNYTLADLQQYLIDIGANNSWEFYKDNEKYQQDFRPPGVELYCYHGAKLKTTEKLLYKNSQSIHDDPTILYGDGDGTVNLKSLEGCNRWTGKQKQTVHHQVFPYVNHMDTLTDKDVLNYIKNTLTPPRPWFS